MCHDNVYKVGLKLDFRPILDAYHLLGYGETLSETSGKVKTNQNLKMFWQFAEMLTFSSNIFFFVEHVTILTLKPI